MLRTICEDRFRESIGASEPARREAEAISLRWRNMRIPIGCLAFLTSQLFNLHNLLAVRSLAKDLLSDIRQGVATDSYAPQRSIIPPSQCLRTTQRPLL
jgi:hypothetical protein